MNFYPLNSFSGILSTAMDRYGVGGTRFAEILKDKDPTLTISHKRISDYLNGKHTPSFERAQLMLKVLEYPISDEELKDALIENRRIIKEETDYTPSEDKELVRTIRFKLKRIVPDVEPEQAERILWERIQSLYDGKNNISAYVQSLVTKDIAEFIVSKEEANKDNE